MLNKIFFSTLMIYLIGLGSATALAGKKSEAPCPAPQLCAELATEMNRCEAGGTNQTCRHFSKVFKKLMSTYSCQKYVDSNDVLPRPVAALWLCSEPSEKYGTPLYHRALDLVSSLKTTRRIFSSDRFRQILGGSYVDMYYQYSIEAKSPLAFANPNDVGRLKAPAEMKRFNQKCPSAKICPRLMHNTRVCEQARTEQACHDFIQTFWQSLLEYDCQPPVKTTGDSQKLVAVLWTCDQNMGDGQPIYFHAFNLLANLNFKGARQLFASPQFRRILEGQYINYYHQASLRLAREIYSQRSLGFGLGLSLGGMNFSIGR